MKAGLGIWFLNGLETIVNNSLYGSEQTAPAGTNEKSFVYTTVRLTLAGKLFGVITILVSLIIQNSKCAER